MIFLPIVGRELRVAARLPATFRNRMLAAGTVAAVAFVMLFFASLTGTPSLIGETTFQTLSYLTLGFSLLEGVRKTADCLSEEKREGTLGLLFLTDLKGYDVVFGKLAATSLNSFYGLVAILPVLALPLLLGGVTPGEYWRVVLALLNILFFSLCAGICVSSRSLRQQQAAGGTLLVIILFSAVPLLTFTRAIYPFSPVYGFHSAFAGNYAGAQGGYWESLGITQLWSWLLLVWASLTVPRSWQDNEAGARWRAARHQQRRWLFGRAESRESMLALNPVFWLAAREQGQERLLYLCVGIAVIGGAIFVASGKLNFLPVFLVCAWLLNLGLKILVAAQATLFFAEARRENALEMLLASPLTVDQIVNGQVLALKRLFLVPVIAVLGLEFAAALLAIIVASFGPAPDVASESLVGVIFGGLVYLLMFFADVAALTWAGMWFGLNSKKEGQAMTKTVFFVVIAPMVALLFWCPGYLFFLGSSPFWMLWAQSKLYRRLREMGGCRYALLPVDLSRTPRPGFGALPTRP
jgi:ABC-type transport system involved in multi-copper enzyme maturation permease subunit